MRVWFYRLVAFVIVSFVIPFCTVIYFREVISGWLILRSDSAKAFLSSRDLWMRRPFTQYKLVVKQKGKIFFPQCRQEFDVLDEKIIAVAENTCMDYIRHKIRPVMTVSEMFADIEKYNLHEVCGPNGCDCDGRYVIRATYDNKFGYPRNFMNELERSPFRDWLSTFQLGRLCTMLGSMHSPSMNITLTPL